jgi:hypothetical protein
MITNLSSKKRKMELMPPHLKRKTIMIMTMKKTQIIAALKTLWPLRTKMMVNAI